MMNRIWIAFALLSIVSAGCAAGAEDAARQGTGAATTSAPASGAPPQAPAAASAPASPAAAPAGDGKLSPDSSADQVLDTLDARGKHLRDFQADVSLEETNPVTLQSFKRSGRVWYQQQGPGDQRIRVTFTRKDTDRGAVAEKIDYVLDDGWLTERDYQRMTQTRRQVLRPGEKVDLLKLGEGPFPLPLGQDKQDVHNLFDVKKLAPAEGLEGVTPPDNTVRLQLTPRPDTQFADDFSSIDVWVDMDSGMPRRIETVDRTGATIRTTDLANVKVNSGVGEAEFKLEKLDLDKWQDRSEAYQP